jgi:hypothetical protein
MHIPVPRPSRLQPRLRQERRGGNLLGFEMSKNTFLDNELETGQSAGDDIPMLANDIDTVINIAVQ